MSAYLISPDLAPNLFRFVDEDADTVRDRVRRWMKDGSIVEITLQSDQPERFLVNFANVRSVHVSSEDRTDMYAERITWFVRNLQHTLLVS